MCPYDFSHEIVLVYANIFLSFLAMVFCLLYIWRAHKIPYGFKDKRGSPALRFLWIAMKGLFFFCMAIMFGISLANLFGYAAEAQLKLIIFTMNISCILASVSTSYARLHWDLTVYKKKFYTDKEQVGSLMVEIDRIVNCDKVCTCTCERCRAIEDHTTKV